MTETRAQVQNEGGMRLAARRLLNPILLRHMTPSRWYSLPLEAGRYALVSALALVVDTGLYMLSLRVGLSTWTAVAIGFCGGLFVAYLGSVVWVFDQHRLRDRRLEFGAFAIIGLAGLCLSQLGVWWFLHSLHWAPLPAKLATALGVFGFNFLMRKALLFSTYKPEQIAWQRDTVLP